MAVAGPVPIPPPATRRTDPGAPPDGLTKVNLSDAVDTFWRAPPAVVTTTSTVAGGRAGAGTAIWVSVIDRKFDGRTRVNVPGESGLPNPTDMAAVNPVPAMVRTVPPAVDPLVGLTVSITGVGAL